MEIFYDWMFYILAFLTLGFALFSVIVPKPVHSVVCAVGVFFSVAALFYLLNSEFNAVVQLGVYGIGVSILLIFALMLCEGKKFKVFPLKFRTVITPALAFLFFLCGFFYINHAFSGFNLSIVKNVSFESFGVEMLTRNIFSFEAISILILCVLAGVCALIVKGGKE